MEPVVLNQPIKSHNSVLELSECTNLVKRLNQSNYEHLHLKLIIRPRNSFYFEILFYFVLGG